MDNKIVSLSISVGPYTTFIDKLTVLAKNNISSYVCVANVHMCIEAYQDETFAALVNQADIVTPDGMPLVRALNMLYGVRQPRVAGMDLLPDLLKEAERNEIGVCFYGGTPTMLKKTVDYCKRFPKLKLTCLISPPFRNLSEIEIKAYVRQINASGAGFLFVALGCPKQEKWMASMKGQINACMVGIGGALPVMVGMQKRAPKWMQKSSLEWLYRLGQEPRRLFRRYAVTNTMFIILLLHQWIWQRLKFK